jgi:DNA-binding GntR family transcriptional regulator
MADLKGSFVADRLAFPRVGADALSGLRRPLATTKEQQVAEFLREKILSGFFRRGQKLKQDEIAKLLDISITPVREALKLLEAQGYVVSASHRGAVVSPFHIDKAVELFELRMLLEGRLTRAAAKRIKPADLAALEELKDAIATALQEGNREVLRAANFRFHFQFYAVADQPQTLDFVRILWAKYPFDLVGIIPGRHARANAEHITFLEALKSGDRRMATQAMLAHIESNWREFNTSYPLHQSE